MPKKGKYDAILIWLHDLGDSAMGYYEIFHDWCLLGNKKVVLMNAEKIPVTAHYDMEMPSWYDFEDFEDI